MRFVPAILLLAVTALCVVLTVVIVFRMFPEETDSGNVAYELKNAYITDMEDGTVYVFYEEKLYEFEGSPGESYTGVADLEVKDGRIQKMYIKPDTADGVLIAYSAEDITIGDVGTVERTQELPLYVVDGTEVTEGGIGDLIVGSSRLTFVFEDGRVCALIQKEKQEIDQIHVLLKNGSEIAWPDLKLTAGASWKLAGKKRKKGEVVAVTELFQVEGSRQVKAACSKGLLYLCDEEGRRIGNGYEGSFAVWQTDEGYVVVNEVPMETYVCCVLPSEMPASYAYEALKAQAVCARTFAYTQMKGDTYAAYGANLDDSTSFQVYNKQERDEATDRAVADTAGQVLTYDGKMIRCYYYDTSPGVTADLSVWGDDRADYLQAVSGLKDAAPEKLSKEKNFLAFIKSTPEALDSDSPYYRWTATIDLSEINDGTYGTLQDIKVKKRNGSGYIIGLECTYEEGSRTLTNENQIRTLLGGGMTRLVLSDQSERSFSLLPSACFAVTKKKGTKRILTGGGFGHGIGMSQRGAGALGKEGKDYAQILGFYYPGTVLKRKK